MTDDLDLICTIRDDAKLIGETLKFLGDFTGKTLRPLSEYERAELKATQAILARIGEDLEDREVEYLEAK